MGLEPITHWLKANCAASCATKSYHMHYKKYLFIIFLKKQQRDIFNRWRLEELHPNFFS